MGLAPYGEPRYVDAHPRRADRPAATTARSAEHASTSTTSHGLTMTNGAFDALFGGPPRTPESPLTQREMDLAASVQVVTEEIMLRMARHVHRETGMREPLPGRRRRAQLRRQRPPPARGAVRAHLDPAGGGRRRRRARAPRCRSGTSVLGNAAPRVAPRATACAARSSARPSPTTRSRRPALGRARCYERLPTRRAARAHRARCSPTRRSSAGSRAAWSSARARSAPAPSSATRARRAMQSVMNLKIKFRESFRPFAPSVLREHVARLVRARRATRPTCCSSRRCATRVASR